LTGDLDSIAKSSLFDKDLDSNEVIKNFKQFTFARDFYYSTYDQEFEDDQYLLGKPTNEINDFYSILYSHLKDSVFSQSIISLSKEESLKDIASYYTHPLNYYSYVVGHYGDQIKLTDQIIHNLKYLDYINKIEGLSNGDLDQSILPEGSSKRRKQELNEEVERDFTKIVEFFLLWMKDIRILTSQRNLQ
jgi:hypothetical protein